MNNLIYIEMTRFLLHTYAKCFTHAGQRCSYKYVSYLILIRCYSHFCVSLIRNYLFTFVEGARNFEPAILSLYHSTYICNFWKIAKFLDTTTASFYTNRGLSFRTSFTNIKVRSWIKNINFQLFFFRLHIRINVDRQE